MTRGVSYLWREAWLLRRLAELYDEQGRGDAAREARTEAAQVFAGIRSKKQ